MFDRAQRYPDARTMQADVRALREGRPPPYATANAQGAVVLAPSPSDAITRDAPTLTTRSIEPTTAASSVRVAPPSADDPSARPTAPDAMAADPATRPAMMVLGAAGLGAPLAPSSRSGATTQPAFAPAQPIPAPPHGGPQTQASTPVGERTLRSVQGPSPANFAPAPQGYVLATTVMPAVHTPLPTSGPRTQLTGTAPPVPPSLPVPSSNLAPGESIPVVAAPPRPRRRLTLPGSESGLLPLIAVGVLFAGIGVGITLWITLRDPDARVNAPTTAPAPRPTPTSTSNWSDGDLDLGQRGAHPGLHATTHAPQPPPRRPTKGR